jgi:hypothetical protein
MNKDTEITEYYYVSVAKFTLFSILSMGLWEIYWFFKNWEYVRDKEKIHISPLLRAGFSPIYAYPLFKRIDFSLKEKGIYIPLSPLFLFLIYVLGFLFSFLTVGLSTLIPSLTFLPLIYLQYQINKIQHPMSETITWPQVVFLVTGIFLWILVILTQILGLSLNLMEL